MLAKRCRTSWRAGISNGQSTKSGLRRGDLLSLEWERDIDLDGSRAAAEGRVGPHIYIRGAKADTPHWMPLHPDAAKALKRLRNIPRIDRLVFPVDSGAKNKGPVVSQAFAELCVRAGLTVSVEHAGKQTVKNKWTLHDLRRKCNTDLRNLGASPKKRATLIGHRSTDVNEEHYEAI